MISDKRRDFLQWTYSRLNFIPTEAQWPALECEARIMLDAGGERAGKSTIGEKYLIARWPEDDLYWIAAKDYETCHPEIDYLFEDARTLGILESYSLPARPDQCSVILSGGTRVETISLKDPLKVGRKAPKGIVVCEAAQIPYSSWLRLVARTAEKRGWILGAGTFEGSLGWYPELFEYYQAPQGEGKSFSIPSWSNTVIYPGGRQDPEILRMESLYPPDQFMERFGGIPCRPSGVVIKEFSNRAHVGDYSYKPDLPVEIAVDPGYLGAHTVLAIQQWGEQTVVVDEVYLQGYVTEEIIDICKVRPWWSPQGGVIDIAGRQHQAMPAPVEIWLLRAKLSLRSRKVEEEAGIDLLRTFLKVHPVTGWPHVLVNHVCKGFISECAGGKSPVLGGGPWLRDTNTGKPIDKDNHACKALIYYLADKFGYTTERRQQIAKVKHY